MFIQYHLINPITTAHTHTYAYVYINLLVNIIANKQSICNAPRSHQLSRHQATETYHSASYSKKRC